jgi:hypothetical protein
MIAGLGQGSEVSMSFEGGPMMMGLPFPFGNLRDYVSDGNLQNVIDSLMGAAANAAPPPAAKGFVRDMPKINITDSHVSAEQECSVCKDVYALKEVVHALPCKHLFHPDCVKPWLNAHNTCPVCRFELPTDDAEYELQIQQAAAEAERTAREQAAAGGSGEFDDEVSLVD